MMLYLGVGGNQNIFSWKIYGWMPYWLKLWRLQEVVILSKTVAKSSVLSKCMHF